MVPPGSFLGSHSSGHLSLQRWISNSSEAPVPSAQSCSMGLLWRCCLLHQGDGIDTEMAQLICV